MILNYVSIIISVIVIVMLIVTHFDSQREMKNWGEPKKIKVKLLENGNMPEYKRVGDACLDCKARQSITIPKKKRDLVPLGFAIELPEDYEGIIRPRSGNTKDGIDIGIGTIDETYRGEVMACVINDSDEDFFIEAGDRICQLAIREAPKFNLIKVSELTKTERNESGFGSSGKK
jgi:dUTP pyrophosphatase